MAAALAEADQAWMTAHLADGVGDAAKIPWSREEMLAWAVTKFGDVAAWIPESFWPALEQLRAQLERPELALGQSKPPGMPTLLEAIDQAQMALKGAKPDLATYRTAMETADLQDQAGILASKLRSDPTEARELAGLMRAVM